MALDNTIFFTEEFAEAVNLLKATMGCACSVVRCFEDYGEYIALYFVKNDNTLSLLFPATASLPDLVSVDINASSIEIKTPNCLKLLSTTNKLEKNFLNTLVEHILVGVLEELSRISEELKVFSTKEFNPTLYWAVV